MLTRQRQMHILDVLTRDGRIVASALSRELGLSEDTIRRDLRDLAEEGHLQRVHGGALPASLAVAGIAARQLISTDAKAALGKAGAALIRPGQVVFLDGGTTTTNLARALAPDLVATIVTHSPSIAVALADHPAVDVVIVGGTLFKHSLVTIGSTASQAIASIRADLYFMGVTGIHPEAGFTTGHFEEAAIKRMLCRQAAETVVLASAEKLGAASPYRIAGIEEIATLVVEASTPPEVTEIYAKMGLEMRTA